ncbi:MAG: caspase family protein [Bacteroidota bacterium]
MKRIFILICTLFSAGLQYGQVLTQNIENAHTGQVISLDADATGSLVLSGGIDNRSHLWDANLSQKVKSFSDSEGYPAVLYSDNSRRFVTSSLSGKVIVWDADSKKPLLLLKGNTSDILSLALNPINNNIAGGGKDGKIIVWDQSGKILINLIGHDSEIIAVSYNFDGTKLISASSSEVKVWDGSNFNPAGTIRPESKSVKAVSVSCNLDKVAVVTGDRTVEVWNADSRIKESNLPGSNHDILAAEFSPDDKYIALGGRDGSLSIVRLSTGETAKEITDAHEASLAELKFTSDGSKLITGGYDGRIKIWNLGSLGVQASLSFQRSTNLYAQNAPQSPEERQYRGDMLKGLGVAYSSGDLQFGNYFALIIGIDNYTGQWTPLQNAVSDAKAINMILRSKYKFDNIKELYDDQATRQNIIRELEWLVENVKPSDNLLIYYSGHGEFNQALNKGYWVPVDARAVSTSYYISNSDIQTFLGGIKSKHTLLISDACFSGDIFRGNTVSVPFEESEKYYVRVNSISSRKALTSGGVEPVLDGGREGHSVFAYYLLKALDTNTKQYFDASQLFDNIKIPVINNSDQAPQFNAIKNAGDEGGQFIFLKK